MERERIPPLERGNGRDRKGEEWEGGAVGMKPFFDAKGRSAIARVSKGRSLKRAILQVILRREKAGPHLGERLLHGRAKKMWTTFKN